MSIITSKVYSAGGNIFILLGSRPTQLEEDILTSTLYSTLLSQKTGTDQQSRWLNYNNTLGNLSWTLSDRATARREFAESTLPELIDSLTEGYLTSPERQAVSETFDKLQKIPDSAGVMTAITQLEQNTQLVSRKTPKLQTITIDLSIITHQNTLLTIQITFDTTSALSSDIFCLTPISAAPNKNNNIRQFSYYFSDTKYAPIRNEIVRKLGSKITTELVEIEDPAIEIEGPGQ